MAAKEILADPIVHAFKVLSSDSFEECTQALDDLFEIFEATGGANGPFSNQIHISLAGLALLFRFRFEGTGEAAKYIKNLSER